MELIRTIFVWNTNSGKFPWNVALGKERLVAKMATAQLAQDFAQKMLGKQVDGFIGSAQSSCKVSEFATIKTCAPD